MNQAIISAAVKVIINTRDFCGNEAEAVQDLCADHGIKAWRDIYKIANFKENAQWNAYKKAAGVNPKYVF